MLKTIHRLVVVGVTVSLTAAGLCNVASPTRATASEAGACIFSGSAAVSPGLGTTPQPTDYTFSGTASPCAAVGTVAGLLSFVIACPLGGLGYCLPTGTVDVAAGPFGPCSGIVLQEGLILELGCSAASGGQVAVAMLSDNNGTVLPITSFALVGVWAGVTL